MKSKIIILIGLLSLILVFDSFGQKTIDAIVKRGEFRVGLTGNQPPFNMKNKQGELMGFEIELAGAIANGLGVPLKMVQMPFSDLLPALESGKIDAIMSGMTVTAERSSKVLFAGPYTVSGKSILAKSSVLEKLQKTQDANNPDYTITCLKGSTSESFARRNMPKATIKAVSNYKEATDLLLSDQADAMVADYAICLITVMRNQGKDLVTLEEPLNIEPIGIALPAGDLHYLNLIDNYIKSLRLVGGMKALEDKWMEDGSWLIHLE